MVICDFLMPKAFLLEATNSGGSPMSLLISTLMMVGMYFLLIRPQRRRMTEGVKAGNNFQSNEVVLLKEDYSYHRKKLGELIFTHINLVVVSKSVFL